MTTVEVGRDCRVADRVTLSQDYGDAEEPTVVGDDATIRSGTILYADVTVGDGFRTGHNVLVREQTTVGDDVLVGTNTVIDGHCTVGSHVSLQSNVYVPTNSTIGDHVFVGPGVVMTNDPLPVRRETELEGPTIEDHVSVGANATLLPGVTVGRGSFVAAGALVTADVPPETLAIGAPARFEELPERLRGENQL